MTEEPKIGRITIIYTVGLPEKVNVNIEGIPPLLAIGILEVATERLKTDALRGGGPQVLVPFPLRPSRS